jgi:sigma-B regulation protein RsbU (phosphoserine phosphatase)
MSDNASLKLLLVDDSLLIRQTLRIILHDLYEIRAAVDGQDGIDNYLADRPDIIILDMNMPQKSGLEVIEHIRTACDDQDTYILMLTSEETSDSKSAALNAGANDYLTKPFNKVELLARVGVAERQVRLTRQLRGAYATIRSEIDMVAQLQRSLLPSGDRSVGGMTVASFYQPSGLASGDYFDYFQGDDDHVRVILADVSGHGARAAFVMAMVRSLFRTTATHYLGLAETLTLINRQLLDILGRDSDFVSIFTADIKRGDGTMEYINAGHCPAILHSGGRIDELEATTTVLGFFDLDFKVERVRLDPGAGLFLFTDGWYEWDTASGEMYGIERFIQTAKDLLSSGGFCFEALFSSLSAAVAGETPSRPEFRDDVSALYVQVES